LGPNELELMEAIRRRRTVRRYKADPVPEDKINHVLEAARLAPSYYNEQSWRFIVVTQEQIKEGLGGLLVGIFSVQGTYSDAILFI